MKIKNDIILIGAVLIIAGSAFAIKGNSDGMYAEVYKDNKQINKVFLSDITEFFVEGKYPLTVAVGNRGVYVKECSCPDKVCKNTGTIKKNGETIVCLPNNTFIKVVKK